MIFGPLHRRHSLEAQWGCNVSHAVRTMTVIMNISWSLVAREEALVVDENIPAQRVERVEPVMVAPEPSWDGFMPGFPLPLESTRRYGHRFVAKLVRISGALRSCTLDARDVGCRFISCTWTFNIKRRVSYRAAFRSMLERPRNPSWP